MSDTFEIPGRLMGMNEYSGLQRSHHYAGARAKRDETERVEAAIMAAGVRKFSCPVEIGITYIEGKKRNGALRDPDNISAGARKFILDALVRQGIIHDDSPHYVRHFFEQFRYNENNPRIQVHIMPAAPEGRSVFFAPVTGIKE